MAVETQSCSSEYSEISDFESLDQTESDTAKGWLVWCRSNPNVKCVEAAIPEGILPKSFKGILIDVKVHGRGPDDKIYSTNKDLRDKVARGNCVLELNHIGKNGTISGTKYIFIIFALKKFSGGMGDEDDSPGYQNLWQNYFIQDKRTAVKVICTKKANGEAAHVSSRKLFMQDYFCMGSKNVHMMVKDKSDIEKYKDSRYMVARTVAETFFRQIMENGECNPDTKNNFIEFLQTQKCTMVNEILQPKYQHIENLSYLEDPQLQFICWTTYKSIEEDDSLCFKSPHLAIDEGRIFGLKTVEYEVIEADVSEEYMAKIRSEFGYEGRVLYFLDNYNNVIGVLKKKTSWYIILRAIREKVCHFTSNKDSTSLEEKRKKITRRIAEIQTWIGFSDSYRDSWIKLAVGFVKWVIATKRGTNSIAVRSQFPTLWKNYLESDEQMDQLYSNLENNYS